jgi:hypothetical protein
MAQVEFSFADRQRTCRICDKPIEKRERGVVMRDVKVGGKTHDLHFHYDCYGSRLSEIVCKMIFE